MNKKLQLLQTLNIIAEGQEEQILETVEKQLLEALYKLARSYDQPTDVKDAVDEAYDILMIKIREPKHLKQGVIEKLTKEYKDTRRFK